MEKLGNQAGNTMSSATSKRHRLRVAATTLLIAGLSVAGVVASTGPASAATGPGSVPNFMRCDPATGWCYQTNPPYNPAFIHYCQWDYTLHNLHSGMWYSGCNQWGSDIR